VLPSIIPAKLARSLEPFDDPAWLFELKHFRSLAYLDARHGNDAYIADLRAYDTFP